MSFFRRGFEDRDKKRGGVLIMTLVFMAMFLVIFMGLAGVVSRIYHQAVLQSQDELAFQVAESGLNYGRWRLAHEPDNLEAETKVLADQFAAEVGSFDLTFEQQEGSSLVGIIATGTTANQPAREVSLRALFGIPSLAQFAAVINEDVWVGGPIKGVVHSNGGVRMDGQSDSLVTSSQETYICQPFHSCNYVEKPGVWGSGEIQDLWEYPVPVVDYNSLTLDLLDIKDIAQENNAYYGPSGVYGYQLIFNDDNTYAIYRVTAKGPIVSSWWPENGWENSSYDVGQQQLLEVREVPSNGVVYIEDNLWVKGDIRDRVTVVAGRFPDTPSTNVDIILNGSISYGGVRDGTRSFGAIAQRHVLIPWSGAEDEMVLDGAFVAQKGRFGRRYYRCSGNSLAHCLKTSLSRYGMIASNLVPVTSWVNSSGQVNNGFQYGEASYDANFLWGSPPYFPTTGQYQFVSWEEVEE